MSKHSLKDPRYLALRIPVLERDSYICQICGADANTVDHIIAIANMTQDQIDEGMPYDTNNMQALCSTCNSRKRDKAITYKQYINDRWLSIDALNA